MQGRYSRQILFAPIGPEGQRRIRAASVSLVGAGAIGSGVAELLARAGAGRIRIFDRDFVEGSNLQRQSLYDEDDVRADLPKAVAAQRRLARVNSDVAVEAFVEDVHAGNVGVVFDGADVVLDGTDNFETRMLLNDEAVRRGTPWIYAGCVGSTGMVMPVRPGSGACFRCAVPALPAPGSTPTCDTAGVLNAAAMLVAAVEAGEALKILAGRADDVLDGVFVMDLWAGRYQVLRLARVPDCPACGRRVFEFLARPREETVAVLCGRNAVQITPARSGHMDLAALERRLAAAGTVRRNEFLLKFRAENLEMTLFPDGRAIVQGTEDAARARSFFARFVGA